MRLWHLFPTGSFAFLDVLKDLIQQHVQNAGEQESAAAVQPLESLELFPQQACRLGKLSVGKMGGFNRSKVANCVLPILS